MLHMIQANTHGKVKEMNKLLALLFGLTLSLPSAHAEITSESFCLRFSMGVLKNPWKTRLSERNLNTVRALPI